MRTFSLLLAAACATSCATSSAGSGSGSGSGTIAIKSFGYPSARPESYSVGKGVISGSNLNLRIDDDGCVRGTMRGEPVQLCRDPANPNHWVGASGDFTAVATPDGKRVNVDGYLSLGTLRQVDITQAMPLGDGPQWNELRKNPVLLALATTATDLDARHHR